jgi:hypothetical protein
LQVPFAPVDGPPLLLVLVPPLLLVEDASPLPLLPLDEEADPDEPPLDADPPREGPDDSVSSLHATRRRRISVWRVVMRMPLTMTLFGGADPARTSTPTTAGS